MNGTHETKKYAADKIALLGLLIVAVLIARLIIASRSAIVLSEPIKLNYAGLSVSVPTGNGWQSEKQWKYRENAFTLSSFFDSGSGKVTGLTSCRYLLATTPATSDMLFKEKTSAVGGAIADTGQTWTDKLTINWVHIKKPKAMFDMFFGTTRLPNNRQLDIEVYQAMGDDDLAGRLFKRITESLKFEDNQLLEAGSEIIAEVKRKGLDSFLGSHFDKEPQNGAPLDNQSRESFFLIKDAAGRIIGFAMDVFVAAAVLQSPDFGQDAQPDIQAASFYYIRGRHDRQQVTFFQGRNNLDEFAWTSETSRTNGRSGAEIVLDKAGTMTVSKFGPKAKDKSYRLGSAAIPDILADLTFSQMLDSSHKKILVDIIDAEGAIIPAVISRIEGQQPPAAEEEAAYVLKVEFLDGQGFSEQVYLDSQRQVSKRLLQQENIYTIERSSAENVLKQFPERAEFILRKKMLEQNQPQY